MYLSATRHGLDIHLTISHTTLFHEKEHVNISQHTPQRATVIRKLESFKKRMGWITQTL